MKAKKLTVADLKKVIGGSKTGNLQNPAEADLEGDAATGSPGHTTFGKANIKV